MADTQAEYLTPGQMFGEFRVVRLLGKGGMGRVYLVEHPESGRFAVKIVDPVKAAKDREYVRRFAREGRFARKHRHPNLIPVHDIGQDPDTGLYYLIMDYMPGGDIGQRLGRDGRFPVEEAVRIVAQVARALEAAHASGMVHRDIKPENIMFDADGTPKLADLGVAKFSDAGQTMLTCADVMIGTPAYMAPEQIMDSHGVDAQADVYSLGIVFFEMLTGRRPNEGLSVVEIVSRAVKGESIPDVRIYRPDVPDSVAHLLNAMCDPDRQRRLTTRQVVTLFGRILAQLHGTAEPPEEAPPQPVPEKPRDGRTPTPEARRALHHLPRLQAETPAPRGLWTPSPTSPEIRLSELRLLVAAYGGRLAAVVLLLLGVLAGVMLNGPSLKRKAEGVRKYIETDLEPRLEEANRPDAEPDDLSGSEEATRLRDVQDRLGQIDKEKAAAAAEVAKLDGELKARQEELNDLQEVRRQKQYDRFPDAGDAVRKQKAERGRLQSEIEMCGTLLKAAKDAGEKLKRRGSLLNELRGLLRGRSEGERKLERKWRGPAGGRG